MSDPLNITEEYVYRIAPDGKSVKAAQDLVQREAYRSPRLTNSGKVLEAQCRGSDPSPYQVQVDLTDRDRPQTGCNCGSYKRPCKHALGLLLLAAKSPDHFEEDESTRTARRRKQPVLEETRPRELPVEATGSPKDLGEALFHAVLETPQDDAPRLIYADWLEENGQADRAEFIRVQIELATATMTPARKKELRGREKDLWAAHRDEWLKSLPPHLRQKQIQYQRGFLEELSVAPSSWEKHGTKLFARHPIYRVRLKGRVTRHEVGALAVIPYLSRVRVLDLSGSNLVEPMKTLEILFGTPFLTGLSRLDLQKAGITSSQLGVLIESPLLARLQELDLAENEVGPKGAITLAESEKVANLRLLNLRANPLGDAGARALAASRHLGEVKTLDLRDVTLGPTVTEALRTTFGERVLLGLS